MFKVETLTLGDMQSNCYILYDTALTTAVIIDPGAEPDVIIDTLDKLNLKAGAILLTHGHFDHIGAVDSLVRIYKRKVYISKEDAILLQDYDLNLSTVFSQCMCVKSAEIVTISEGNLKICGLNFEVLETPGHSNGSVCFVHENVIFTGDTLFYQSIGNAFAPYGDINTEIASINDKLFTLKGNYTCYPGHGIPTSIEHEKTCNPYLGGLSNGY